MRCGHLTYDPWIWLKVTSPSSTASDLNDGRISLEIPSFCSEIFFFQNIKIRWFYPLAYWFQGLKWFWKPQWPQWPQQTSQHHWPQWPQQPLWPQKIKSCLHFNYWMISLPSGTSAASMTSVASTASYHQKTYWAWCCY